MASTTGTTDRSRDASRSEPSASDQHSGATESIDAGAERVEERVKDDARSAMDMAKERARAGVRQAAHEADSLADAAAAVASSLSEQDKEGLATYARKLSDNLSNLANRLQGRSVDELVDDARRLARNNPAMFMLGSVAVGFGLSRFLKASDSHSHSEHEPESGYGSDREYPRYDRPDERERAARGETSDERTQAADVEADLGTPGSNVEFSAPPDEVAPSTIVHESVQYNKRDTTHE